jgi:polyhydroxybutyrate depolymerase
LTLALFLPAAACDKQDDPNEPGNRIGDRIQVDGRIRTFTLVLPENYSIGSDFALVIAVHGGGGDADQFESTSKLTEKARSSGFMVVYPEGVRSNGLLGLRTWNAGGCCEYAMDNNIDDVKFLSLLVDHLLATYKINPKRVYATGHSNGGMMSYRLACELADKIAAIAVSGCTMVVNRECLPSRPVPVMHLHSVLDSRVPYLGGIGISNVYYPPVDSGLMVWSGINGCQQTAKVLIDNSDYKLTRWSDCLGQVTIQYFLTRDGGHGWPGGLPGGPFSDTPSKVINANDLLWDFFSRYQLP